MKKIAILGASGSIGTSTIEIIKKYPDEFSLIGISVYSKVNVLETLLKEFPSLKVVAVRSLKEVESYILANPNVKFYEGEEGLKQVATCACDVVVNALVGFVGLLPTIQAIQAKKDIALANKETLVVAGKLIMDLVKQYQVCLYPIDSEHSAIFQCLEANNPIKKVLITASGGPFLKKSLAEIENVSVEQALNHPNWSMGKKITIDSATMMNKAFEMIEAKWLFDLKANQIEVVVHPQSNIHSMVAFEDGSIKAQLGIADMKIPIAYALSYPNRLKQVSPELSFKNDLVFQFYPIDTNRFEAIALALRGFEIQGTYFAIMNAANEEAVQMFLNHEISFGSIIRIVKQTLAACKIDKQVTIEKILAADKWAREYVRRLKNV